MLNQLRESDIMIAAKYDRFEGLAGDSGDDSERSADFRDLTEGIDTTTPADRLVLHIVTSITKVEHGRISEFFPEA